MKEAIIQTVCYLRNLVRVKPAHATRRITKTMRFHNSHFILHRLLWLLLAAFAPSAHAAPGDVDVGFDPKVGDIIGTVGQRLGYVYSTAVQPDGKLIIGGEFPTVGGVPRTNIARLNADGTLDPDFNPNANNSVYSTAVQSDGKIVIAGEFTAVGGTARSGIARLNMDGTLDVGFNPNPNYSVCCTAVQPDGKIVIGGGFTTVSGAARNYVARLNPSGTLDPGFNPNASDVVLSMAVQADGKIVLGGAFVTLGNAARRRIARVNADGTLDPSFNPVANDFVLCMLVQAEGKIVIGGLFDFIGAMTPRSFLARLNTDGTLDMPFNPGPNDFVWSLTMQVDGKIIIGGWFDMVGGTAHSHVARLNADGTVDTAFNPQAGGPVVFNTSLQSDGRIVIGGTFTNVDGLVRNRVARLVNDSATQSLIVPNASRVEWRRGGASPEAQDVSFEVSADDGTTWRLLGAGTRIAGGWEKDGLSLPVTGQVRARARVVGGQNNGSSGLVETVTAYSLLTSRLTGATLLGNGSFQFGFTNLSGVPFTALGTTNLTLPSSNWNVLGPATEIFPGQFQFIDLSATNFPRRFYQIRSP